MKDREITILEDDSDIREICTYFFTNEGFKVNSYATVAEFYGAHTKPSVFLLDVRLPDGNGLEVCHTLKNDRENNHIPIIMMSAHMDIEVMMERSGAEHFISKPFDLDQLLAKVISLIK